MGLVYIHTSNACSPTANPNPTTPHQPTEEEGGGRRGCTGCQARGAVEHGLDERGRAAGLDGGAAAGVYVDVCVCVGIYYKHWIWDCGIVVVVRMRTLCG